MIAIVIPKENFLKKTIEWKVLDHFDFLIKFKIDNKAMCWIYISINILPKIV
jgi:hypothetical protein